MGKSDERGFIIGRNDVTRTETQREKPIMGIAFRGEGLWAGPTKQGSIFILGG